MKNTKNFLLFNLLLMLLFSCNKEEVINEKVDILNEKKELIVKSKKVLFDNSNDSSRKSGINQFGCQGIGTLPSFEIEYSCEAPLFPSGNQFGLIEFNFGEYNYNSNWEEVHLLLEIEASDQCMTHLYDQYCSPPDPSNTDYYNFEFTYEEANNGSFSIVHEYSPTQFIPADLIITKRAFRWRIGFRARQGTLVCESFKGWNGQNMAVCVE